MFIYSLYNILLLFNVYINELMFIYSLYNTLLLFNVYINDSCLYTESV